MTIVSKLLGLMRKDGNKNSNSMQSKKEDIGIPEDYEVKILALIGSFIAYEWIGAGFEEEFKSNLSKEDTLPLSINIYRTGDTDAMGDCEVTGNITSELNDLVMTIKSVRKKGYLKSFSVAVDEINGEEVNIHFNQSPFYANPGLTMIDITKKVTEDISLLFNKE